MLRELLVCARCRGDLIWTSESARCRECAAAYEVANGIPMLLEPGDSPADPLKAGQAAFFDAEDAEFEIMRPHGAPALYGRLLEEKFRRGVSRLGTTLADGRALVVCGGSGMDAEFLARAGAWVVSSDISLGAAERARQRADRYGLSVRAIVADVEQLPFRDRAFDVVYVHDGLHHLGRPEAGLAEMARVSGTAVSVNEPARAALTALAVRLGLALAQEAAGNEVMRLTPDEVASELRACGFRVIEASRYGMYYRHSPGSVARLLSRRKVMPVAERTLAALNDGLGRFGNKLAVQAVRESPGAAGASASVCRGSLFRYVDEDALERLVLPAPDLRA
jgi:SAM-dependent methyltransferase